ncbi:NAD(P)-binding protein [Mycena epipterygia]|nr:NAD(P)-binding protein [Mycena epipterygia]
MSDTSYKSFAVVGGGTIGLPIVNALAAKNVSVVLLSRPGSSTKTVPSGVEVATVDFKDASAVAAVFKAHKVDVVLSTLATTATTAQNSLVDAAKLASVKLFAPSEYGMPTDGQEQSFLGQKKQLAEYLKAAGIPSARFYTGMFSDFVPLIVGYTDHGKIRIVGEGNAPVSFTSIPDIAGFVAYVLTNLPPSELNDRVFRLEGDRATMKDLGALFKTSVEHADQITGEMGEFKTYLLSVLESGAGSTGWDEERKAEGSGSNAAGSSNALWPGHQWQTMKEVHNL